MHLIPDAECGDKDERRATVTATRSVHRPEQSVPVSVCSQQQQLPFGQRTLYLKAMHSSRSSEHLLDGGELLALVAPRLLAELTLGSVYPVPAGDVNNATFL